MVAAEYNKLPIVMSLIKHGANLNLQDDLGKFHCVLDHEFNVR